MTIQDIGAIGELLAAIATIAILFYFARQPQTASRVEITRNYLQISRDEY